MEELIEVLEDTPWWVYLVFFWLIFSGVQAMRPRTVPMVKLFILPTLLVLWSFHGVFIRWEGNWIDVCYWIISLGAGAFLGWWMIHKWKIYVDRSRKTLMLPGTKSTLWLALLIFGIRYFFSYYEALHPTMPHSVFLIDIIATGIIAGIFIGRTLNLWYRYENVR